jgi:hypothetical protein
VDAEDAKKRQLLEAVADHELVKAAAFIDDTGEILRREGAADVFREDAGSEGDTAETSPHGAREDVFLEEIAGQYLVVVFPARGDFESIKHEVDELRERLVL